MVVAKSQLWVRLEQQAGDLCMPITAAPAVNRFEWTRGGSGQGFGFGADALRQEVPDRGHFARAGGEKQFALADVIVDRCQHSQHGRFIGQQAEARKQRQEAHHRTGEDRPFHAFFPRACWMIASM